MRLPYLVLTAVLVVLAGLGGFAVGNKGTLGPVGTPGVGSNAANSSFFDTQNATVQGQVLKADNGSVTIKNKKGEEQTLATSSQLFITKFNAGGAPATPSSDLKTVELNKDSIINVAMQDGTYKVVSISVVPPVPTPPPAPKNVAPPANGTTPPPPPPAATGVPAPASSAPAASARP